MAQEGKTFYSKLIELINCHSLENGSNTPDYVLAEFLMHALEAFDSAVVKRGLFYNDPEISKTEVGPQLECGKVHNLKTWMPQFQYIVDEKKLFDFRKNDRDYKVGDMLNLQEYNQGTKEFTGRSVLVQNVYQVNGGIFGIPEGYCIMSIKIVPSL